MKAGFYILLVAMLIITGCASDNLHSDNITTHQSALLQEVFGAQIPQAKGWVNDWADVFTDEEEMLLNKLIANNEAGTTNEIAIVTYPADVVTLDKYDSLTTALANAWGVGKKEKNNGIVISISPSLRRIRISNGYGIEHRLTDNQTAQIIDTCFVPLFKAAKYYEGTTKGINAIIAHLATH